MRSLRQMVFDAYRQQQAGGVGGALDPKMWQKLLDSAVDDMSDGYNTLTSPVAPWTAEVKMTLPGADSGGGTARIPMEFPYPVIVVGFRPVVIPVFPVPMGVTLATTDDIDVQMDINLQAELNQTFAIAGVATTQGNNFVTLSGIGIQVPRLFGAALTDPRPTIGFTCRWTQSSPPPAAPIHPDTIIKIAAYYIPLHPRESANVQASMRNAP